MKLTNLILAITFSMGLLACSDAASGNEMGNANENSNGELDLTSLQFSSDQNSLNESEKAGLLLMREEEKLAGDVYAYFYGKYELRPFTNINKSEVRHSTAVLSLLTYFGLEDPAQTEAGKFTNADIQALYDKLTAAGSTAELALSTGAFIEEYDIADLRKLISESQNADIKTVYSRLLSGSYNHIKAFTRVLGFRNVTYTPQILTSSEYNEILAK
ncbi:MAG: DUF2202 domain-containing protein [Bacteroidales bacterium]|nr:DUF2202 domain-containing protein [Bacteroidales bacterium]